MATITYRYRCPLEGIDIHEDLLDTDPVPTVCINDGTAITAGSLFITEGNSYVTNLSVKKYISMDAGGAGLQDISNMVLVNSESDFPAPVAGVITLDTQYIYRIIGNVVITNSINPNDATITGTNRTNDKLQLSTNNIDMFVGTSGIVAYNVAFQCDGTTSSLFNITGTGVEIFNFQNCKFCNCTNLGIISTFYAGNFTSCIYRANLAGIRLDTIANVGMRDAIWFPDNAADWLLMFSGAFSIINISGGGMSIPFAKVGIKLSDATYPVTSVAEIGKIFDVAFIGLGAPVDSETIFLSSTWEVFSPRISQSYTDVASTAFMYVSTKVNTTFTGTSVFTKILGTTTIGSALRFTMSGNNELRYDGKLGVYKNIAVHLSANTAATNENVEIAVFKNGAIIPGSNMDGQTKTTADKQVISLCCATKLVTNDLISVYIKNITSTNYISVNYMTVTVV